MYKFITLLLILVINSSFISFQNEEEKAPIEILASTFEVFETKDINPVWPKFELKSLPTIIHFENGHIYSFGLPQNDKWETITVKGQKFQFSDKDPWGVTKVMMHPGFMVEGKKSFIFKMNAGMKDLTLPILTFVHERFHLHQFSYFNRDGEKSGGYSKEWDEQNQVFIGLENWLLEQFLIEKENPSRLELIKDFIAVNSARQKLLDPSSVTWEDLQQRMEGLADYVCLKTFATFPLLKDFNAETIMLKMRQNKTSVHYSVVNDAIKGRHYFVGAALGFALDFCKADWKLKTEQGAPLREILAQSLALTSVEMETRVEKIKNSLVYSRISESIKEKLSQEKGEIDGIIARYNILDGIQVRVGRPQQPFSGGGRNHKSVQMGNGKTVSIRDISFSSSRDNKWKLKFKDIPLVFEDNHGGRIFKMDGQTSIQIDDEKFSLKDLMKESKSLSFSSIKWEGTQCELHAELPGTLECSEDQVLIHFLN